MSPAISTGSRMPVEARAGSTAAKMARLTVLAPLTAVLEKPTSRAAKARAANSQPVRCHSVMVSIAGTDAMRTRPAA